MTSNDFTMYPFSTQNLKDYHNLLSVYLDSVFFPLLKYEDFMQEGHRIELNEETTSNFQFKGIVFNEMKGAMSDTHSLFYANVNKHLYNQSTYQYNSGGDPLEILNLTYDDLKSFHKQCYHPNNALFYSYGTFNPIDTMKVIENQVLYKFKSKKKLSKQWIAYEPRRNLTRPMLKEEGEEKEEKEKESSSSSSIITVDSAYDPIVIDKNKQSKLSQTYLLPALGQFKSDISISTEDFLLKLLSALLLSGPKAPMYQALIKNKLGTSYSPYSGYDGDRKEGIFALGLSDINKEDVADIMNIIQQTLIHCKEHGFEAERIDAIIHQLELSLKIVKNQFGLSLLYRIIPLWVHNRNISAIFQLQPIITMLKDIDQQLLADMIQYYFLDNQHVIHLLMNPNEHYNQQLQDQEDQVLSLKTSSLNKAQIEQIKQQQLKLKEIQNTKVNVDVLPTLTIDDIDPQGIYYNIQSLSNHQLEHNDSKYHNKIGLYSSEQPANGISYVKGLIDINSLSLTDHELYQLLPLYSSYTTSIGAGKYQYDDLLQQIDLYTGGITSSYIMVNDYQSHQLQHIYLSYSSYALDHNIDQMQSLMDLCKNQANFHDIKRLEILLNKTLSSLANELQDNGHSYAALYAAKDLTSYHYLKNQLYGIPYIQYLQQFDDIKVLSAKLMEITSHIPQIYDKMLYIGNSQSLATMQDQLSFQVKTPKSVTNDAITGAGSAGTNNTASIADNPSSSYIDMINNTFQYKPIGIHIFHYLSKLIIVICPC